MNTPEAQRAEPHNAGLIHRMKSTSASIMRAAKRTSIRKSALAIAAAAIIPAAIIACGAEAPASQPPADATASNTAVPTRPIETDANQADAAAPTTHARSQPTTGNNQPSTRPTPTEAPTATPEPTLPPTPTPSQHHEFTKFMAPLRDNRDDSPLYRMPDDGTENPLYPFNEIRGRDDKKDYYYPQYTDHPDRGRSKLKYPYITNSLRPKTIDAIIDTSLGQVIRQITPEEEAAGAKIYHIDRMRLYLDGQLRHRAEWQLVSSTPEEMVINIVSYFMHPEDIESMASIERKPVVTFRVTATAVIKSKASPHYGREPEFSHIIGEPIIEKTASIDYSRSTAATPTPGPTLTPRPTPVHHEFTKFMAPLVYHNDSPLYRMPYDGNANPLYRMPYDGNANAFYPFNALSRYLGGGPTLYYPQYRGHPDKYNTELKYPKVTEDLRSQTIDAIIDTSKEEVIRQITPEEEAAGADLRLHKHFEWRLVRQQLENRAEWQLVSSPPGEMVVNIVTYFMHPEDTGSREGKKPVVTFRITATAIIKSVETPYYHRSSVEDERIPEFSHLIGEPIVEKMASSVNNQSSQ